MSILVSSNGATFALTIGGNEGNCNPPATRSPDGRRARAANPEQSVHLRRRGFLRLVSTVEKQRWRLPGGRRLFWRPMRPSARRDAAGGAGVLSKLRPIQTGDTSGVHHAQIQSQRYAHRSRRGDPLHHFAQHSRGRFRTSSGNAANFRPLHRGPRWRAGADGSDNERAFHAGNSQMNARSIGIEHVAKLGDRITEAQSSTSIALIRFLMQTHQKLRSENIIPHVCVKPTDCCGDLLKDFGGGGGPHVQRATRGGSRLAGHNGIGVRGRDDGRRDHRNRSVAPAQHSSSSKPQRMRSGGGWQRRSSTSRRRRVIRRDVSRSICCDRMTAADGPKSPA